MAGEDIIMATQREREAVAYRTEAIEGSLKQTEAAEILSFKHQADGKDNDSGKVRRFSGTSAQISGRRIEQRTASGGQDQR